MKTRLTLRLVIGFVCAAVVLIVAVITLAITYTVSLATVRDVGKSYAKALATTARVETEDFFNIPVAHGQSIAKMFLQLDFDIPFADPMAPDPRAHDKYWHMHYGFHIASNFTYAQSGIIFDDGGGHDSYYLTDDGLVMGSRFRMNWPQGDMQLRVYAVNVTNCSPFADPTSFIAARQYLPTNLDARFPAYYSAKQLIGTNRNGMWYPVVLYRPIETAFFFLPMVIPIFNRTGHYIGFGTVGCPIGVISTFLVGIKFTPHTEAFAIEASGLILAASHQVPSYTITYSANPNPQLSFGCTASSSTDFNVQNFTYVGCRLAATAFSAYPPLVSIATSNPEFLTTSGTAAMETAVNGDNYFMVSTMVQNSYRFWGLNIVLIMPEADIIGDIVTGRNTAIGITAAVCVVAAVFSFMLVFVLLQPLTTMSKKMLDTAKLRETEEDKEFSNLAEIQDLQKAYSNMNTAIKSFTRYVPRDVVKDLMSTGQLCEINMVPQRCTMLFVDIAGFTTVCERVPPDVLSGLVSQYFDRASRIVMDHDGLIDKFIGDCIMAVWGAPFATPNQEVKATLTGKLLDRETVVDPLARAWDEAGEQLRIRVGISTGEVLAGNMGSAERMNYTVIGDPVNLAARLESMNRQFGTRVMVSEMTAEGLGNVFVLRLLLPIAVVGKEQPVKVYEVMGLQRTMDPGDVDRMQAMDENLGGDGKEASDSNSESQRSAASSTNRYRRQRKQTNAMIRDAMLKTSQDTPVTCSEDEVQFAQQYTKTVLQYLRRDFRGALASLGNLRKLTPGHLLSPALSSGPNVRSCFPEKSMIMLEQLCEGYAVSCPEDFTGVYTAVEK